MADYIGLVKDQWTAIPQHQIDVSGKTFVVTGSNTGLGFCIAEELVRNGAIKVYLAVRSLSKGETAKQRIEKSTGRKGVAEVMQLDMANKQSIQEFVKQLSALDRVDGVVENAALAVDKYSTVEGVETTLYVNVIGTMLLTKEILPILQRSGKKYNNIPFISIVGSEMAIFNATKAAAAPLLKSNEDPYEFLGEKDLYNRYPLTKLLLLWCFRQFAAENPVEKTGVSVNYTNPGLCYSDLGRDTAWFYRLFLGTLRWLLARTTEAGGHILVLSALAGEHSHGKYLTNSVVHDERIPDYITNADGQRMQQKVWADTQKRF